MKTYCKHEEKNCQRCGNSFECKPCDIANCQCHGVRLTNEASAFINKNYDDCLCRACLDEINNKQAVLTGTPSSDI